MVVSADLTAVCFGSLLRSSVCSLLLRRSVCGLLLRRSARGLSLRRSVCGLLFRRSAVYLGYGKSAYAGGVPSFSLCNSFFGFYIGSLSFHKK